MNLKITQRLGFLLLAVFLILLGLVYLIGLNFAGLNPIMGVIAIAAGILILIDR